MAKCLLKSNSAQSNDNPVNRQRKPSRVEGKPTQAFRYMAKVGTGNTVCQQIFCAWQESSSIDDSQGP